jgi:hypothetical protein
VAGCDYRSCDRCRAKTFYDAQLDYDFNDPDRPLGLYGLGDWAVLCEECAKTHKCVVVKREDVPAAAEPKESK